MDARAGTMTPDSMPPELLALFKPAKRGCSVPTVKSTWCLRPFTDWCEACFTPSTVA